MSFKARLLLLEAHQEREGPADVVAPVEVVADPGGERGKARVELQRLVAEGARRPSIEAVQKIDVGVAQVADRGLRARVLVVERDVDCRGGAAWPIGWLSGSAGERRSRPSLATAPRDSPNVGWAVEHDAGARPLPSRLEGFEVAVLRRALDVVGELFVGGGADRRSRRARANGARAARRRGPSGGSASARKSSKPISPASSRRERSNATLTMGLSAGVSGICVRSARSSSRKLELVELAACGLLCLFQHSLKSSTHAVPCPRVRREADERTADREELET